MEKYRVIYRLSFRHEYNEEEICNAIEVRVNPSNMDLMKRYGLLFKQTQVNEWSLLYSGKDIEKFPWNILLFDLYLVDPAFVLYTEWAGFDPAFMYELTLPAVDHEAVKAIQKTTHKRKLGLGFCVAQLHINEILCPGGYVSTTLNFHSKEAYWEYWFITRNREIPKVDKFTFKDQNEVVKFGALELDKDGKTFGRPAMKTKSTDLIKMKEQYKSDLLLTKELEGSLTTHVPCPRLGIFRSEAPDVLRQICYI